MQKTTLAIFIFAFAFLSVLAGCGDAGTDNVAVANRNVNMTNNATVNTVNNTAAATEVKVADITGNMNNYVGKTVVVNGWVESSYAANAFRLDEDSVFTGGIDNDLLVVGANNVIPAGLKFGNADARVSVTGTVRRMVVAEIERDYGIDLTNEVEAEFRDKPVLVANSVRTLEREE